MTGLSWRQASAHRLVHGQASPVQSGGQLPAWSHSSRGPVAPDNSWRPGRRLPATSKCCCFLRLKCSIPKVPLSAKQKQSPRGPDPATEEQRRSQFSVFQRLSAVSGTITQWGEGDGHVIFKLEDKVVLVQAFVSGGRPLVA